MHFFLSALDCRCDVTSYLSSRLDFSTIIKFNLALKAKINSFYPKLLFDQVFYWETNKTEHLLNMRFLRKILLFTYTLDKLHVVMIKERRKETGLHFICSV